jgi:hypothetical protein
MQNIIAFPKKAVAQPLATTAAGAKTLFLHIRRTTLIVHLAAQPLSAATGSRIGKQL